MSKINKPAQPLIPPASTEDVEALIAADTTHAPLVNDLVPAENLPSYVDDVVEFEDLAHFPAEGEEGKIYVALNTDETYRWSGSTYIQIGGSTKLEWKGRSLVIPDIDVPTTDPVITIDGVSYYHATELDINAVKTQLIEDGDFSSKSLCTFADNHVQNNLVIKISKTSSAADGYAIYFGCDYYLDQSYVSSVYPQPGDYSHIIGWSQFGDGYALPSTLYLVGSNDPVTLADNTDTPNIGAAYLKYDENTGILHCYYNIGFIPDYVDSIKQGNNTIPIHIQSGSAGPGQILTADGRGGTGWSSFTTGTSLYTHDISFTYNYGGIHLYLINTNPNPIQLNALPLIYMAPLYSLVAWVNSNYDKTVLLALDADRASIVYDVLSVEDEIVKVKRHKFTIADIVSWNDNVNSLNIT